MNEYASMRPYARPVAEKIFPSDQQGSEDVGFFGEQRRRDEYGYSGSGSGSGGVWEDEDGEDDEDESNVELEKSNVLLFGPTGCGKTLIIKTLGDICKVPVVTCDATTLTPSRIRRRRRRVCLAQVVTRGELRRSVGRTRHRLRG